MRRASAILAALLLAACTSGSSVESSVGADASDSTDASTTQDGGTSALDASPDPTCALSSSSDLPGVKIVFTPQGCTFTLAHAAAGISIGYDVVVDADVDGIIPAGQSSAPQAGPSGLIVFEKLAGGGPITAPSRGTARTGRARPTRATRRALPFPPATTSST